MVHIYIFKPNCDTCSMFFGVPLPKQTDLLEVYAMQTTSLRSQLISRDMASCWTLLSRGQHPAVLRHWKLPSWLTRHQRSSLPSAFLKDVIADHNTSRCAP